MTICKILLFLGGIGRALFAVSKTLIFLLVSKASRSGANYVMWVVSLCQKKSKML